METYENKTLHELLGRSAISRKFIRGGWEMLIFDCLMDYISSVCFFSCFISIQLFLNSVQYSVSKSIWFQVYFVIPFAIDFNPNWRSHINYIKSEWNYQTKSLFSYVWKSLISDGKKHGFIFRFLPFKMSFYRYFSKIRKFNINFKLRKLIESFSLS